MNMITIDHQPPASIVRLNRPDKRNALSRELIAALAEAFERVTHDPTVRVVILTGAGTAFCAGMDLEELQSTLSLDSDSPVIWEDTQRLARLYQQIYTLPKPTIAAVQGAAVAGGAGLVSVCDLALATPNAKFGYPEVRRGLVAAMVLPHLLRHVGERMARYLLLTGELIDAATAQQVGLINATVAEADLLPTATRWAQALAEGGPEALAATKQFLRQCSQLSVTVEETARASAAPRLGAECRLGLAAFFAKQPPPWLRGETS